ncbi:hypothetical protein GCM10010193_69410 [Kitasatospora atroaurantiaca]|uniref:helix-turn-helix domain-containing protein n=1 Tax=Kitasatospora atroaurantiaca TaxID=285545 RepID=UPI0011A0B46B|nr:helix-turn-helix transcriptional regulator [Kitasatospora atroaurantiaca]
MGRHPTPPGQLSPAERRVLAALADGLTPAEVAGEQHLARETVNDHALSARRRLGARTTVQAVAIAVRRGLLDDRPATLHAA